MPDLTPPQLAWVIAGCPTPTKLKSRKEGRVSIKLEPHAGACATCAGSMTEGLRVAHVLNETFSQHADYLKWGSHVCPACAWWYGDPKAHHRSFLAADGLGLLWPVLGEASVAEGRPLWRDALHMLAKLPDDAPVVALLTTDPKPRLWPRVAAGAVARLNLYVHSGDDDISATVPLDLTRLLATVSVVEEALTAGFTKSACKTSLLADHKRVGKDMRAAMELERRLTVLRGESEFLPAVLVSVKQTPRDPEWLL